VNGKKYLGVSLSPQRRLNCHKRSATAIGNALRKYGVSQFTLITLFIAPEWLCYQLEDDLITAYESWNTGHGYNVARGGSRPPNLRGAAHPMFGKPRSEATKAKIRAARALQGPIPAEAYRKRSDTYSYRGENNPNAKYTEEQVRRAKRYKGTMTLDKAVIELGMGRGAVHNIWTGATWGHLT
jgi:hypothetical protein